MLSFVIDLDVIWISNSAIESSIEGDVKNKWLFVLIKVAEYGMWRSEDISDNNG